MISFLRGYVAAVGDGCAVLDVNGVGYEVHISSETTQWLAGNGTDEEVTVYTYLYIREDQIALYGFQTREDLDLFKLLITVSGVGPKAGLALLSTGTADDLRFAIMTGDAKMIARAQGVGRKTAERLILELRDKVAGMFDPEKIAAHAIGSEGTASGGIRISDIENATGSAGAQSSAEEAVEALTALGYFRGEASKAVRSALKSLQGTGEGREGSLTEPDTETILKAALKYF